MTKINYTNEMLNEKLAQYNTLQVDPKATGDQLAKALADLQKELSECNKQIKLGKYHIWLETADPIKSALMDGLVPQIKLSNEKMPNSNIALKKVDNTVKKLELLDFVEFAEDFGKFICKPGFKSKLKKLMVAFNNATQKSLKAEADASLVKMPAEMDIIDVGVEFKEYSNTELTKALSNVLNSIVDMEGKKITGFDVKFINKVVYKASRDKVAKLVVPRFETFVSGVCEVAYKVLNNTKYELIER